jgi:hypothetical protein
MAQSSTTHIYPANLEVERAASLQSQSMGRTRVKDCSEFFISFSIS